jgi:hypothetical protein
VLRPPATLCNPSGIEFNRCITSAHKDTAPSLGAFHLIGGLTWKGTFVQVNRKCDSYLLNVIPEGCQTVAGGRSEAETSGKGHQKILCTPGGVPEIAMNESREFQIGD